MSVLQSATTVSKLSYASSCLQSYASVNVSGFAYAPTAKKASISKPVPAVKAVIAKSSPIMSPTKAQQTPNIAQGIGRTVRGSFAYRASAPLFKIIGLAKSKAPNTSSNPAPESLELEDAETIAPSTAPSKSYTETDISTQSIKAASNNGNFILATQRETTVELEDKALAAEFEVTIGEFMEPTCYKELVAMHKPFTEGRRRELDNATTDFATVTPCEKYQKAAMTLLRELEEGGRQFEANRVREDIFIAFDSYIKLSARIHAKQNSRFASEDLTNDLIAVSKEALSTSINSWDARHNKPLSCLASRWISRSCKTETAKNRTANLNIPTKIRKEISEYRNLANESYDRGEEFLRNKRYRKSTAQAIRMLKDEANSAGLKLDDPIAGGADSTIGDCIADTSFHSNPVRETESKSILEKLLGTLEDARMKFILYLRFPGAINPKTVTGLEDDFGNPLEVPEPEKIPEGITLQKIGSLLGLTRERVRQLEKASKVMMKDAAQNLGLMSDDDLEGMMTAFG